MSYGPNYPGLFRRAADDADQIRGGAKPGDIPIQVDQIAPRKAGRTLPQTLPTRASEVIE